MKKLLLVLLLAVGVGYAYWPYHTVRKLEDAFRTADQNALERLIDFPAVRQSLKDQMKAKNIVETLEGGADASAASNQPSQANVVSALLAGVVADKVIDSMVTPENIARMLKFDAALGSGATVTLHDKIWHTAVDFSARAADDSRFKFRLGGIDGWRVVSIEPGLKLGKQAQIPR